MFIYLFHIQLVYQNIHSRVYSLEIPYSGAVFAAPSRSRTTSSGVKYGIDPPPFVVCFIFLMGKEGGTDAVDSVRPTIQKYNTHTQW